MKTKDTPPTIKEIKTVLLNLLSDFEDEVNQNAEWKLGDTGSWTKNIRATEKLLKRLDVTDNILSIGTKIYAVHKNYIGKQNGILRIGRIATYQNIDGKILPIATATDRKGEINASTHEFYTDLETAINAINN